MCILHGCFVVIPLTEAVQKTYILLIKATMIRRVEPDSKKVGE
tara:strand:- start:1412 stop:1540 length:129 start_codon:yes stop_codon:yes gene_type:complete